MTTTTGLSDTRTALPAARGVGHPTRPERLGRSPDSGHPSVPGTVRRVTVRGRLIIAAAAVLLIAGAGVAGWQIADRTHPGFCVKETDGVCVYELTPHRDGTVTIRMDVDGMPHRNDRVPGECLRSLDPLPQCPDWIVSTPAATGTPA
jgi:hypothetical protein